MRRSKWKRLPHINKEKGKYSRVKIIDPTMINEEIEVSNGKTTKLIKITTDHIGHRVGEFYDSKKTPRYKRNEK